MARDTCCEIALGWMSLDLTDDKSTLVQVVAWCRQATSHYRSQCWPSFCRHMASLGLNELNDFTSHLDPGHFAYFGLHLIVPAMDFGVPCIGVKAIVTSLNTVSSQPPTSGFGCRCCRSQWHRPYELVKIWCWWLSHPMFFVPVRTPPPPPPPPAADYFWTTVCTSFIFGTIVGPAL